MPRPLSDADVQRFDLVPAPVARRARVWVVPFLAPGSRGMCLGRHVLIKRGAEDDEKLLAHELVHARQWVEFGVVGFLVRYASSYVWGLARRRRHRLAYLDIPFEAEARREAAAWIRRYGV